MLRFGSMTDVMYHSVISGSCLRNRGYVSNRDVYANPILHPTTLQLCVKRCAFMTHPDSCTLGQFRDSELCFTDFLEHSPSSLPSLCEVPHIVQDVRAQIIQRQGPPLSTVNEKPWDALAVNSAACSTCFCVPPRPILKVSNHCLIRLFCHVDSGKGCGEGPFSVTVHLLLVCLSKEREEIGGFHTVQCKHLVDVDIVVTNRRNQYKNDMPLVPESLSSELSTQEYNHKWSNMLGQLG